MSKVKKIINLSDYLKKDSFAVLLLSIMLFIYLVPGLFAIDKIFFDDASLGFSRINGVARLVKNGEIPLWDPYSFTGSRPYFAMVESPIYNILLYPLFLISNPDNINQSFTILYLIPYTFLIMLSGIGCYFFTRKILNFHIIASFVSGFLYATSPALGASLKSIHNTQVFAFIPWVLLFIFLYLNTKKLKYWLSAILFLLLLSCSVTLNYVIRSYFLMGTIVFSACIFLLYKKEINILNFINALLVFVISMALLSFIWLGMLEGTSWIKAQRSFEYTALVSYPHYNMFPGYIMNLFMQDFHGLISCDHAWGNAVKYDNNVLLSGGFFSALMIFISFYLYYRKNEERTFNSTEYRKRILFWILFIIMILTLFVMMGKFTPFYFIFCMLIPWVFRFPFAFYFLFYQGFTFSILAGYGMDFLSKEEIRNEFNKNKIIFIYIAAVVLLMVLSLIEPVYTNKEAYLASWKTLFDLKEINWFLINKILLLILFTAASIIIFFNLKKSFYFITLIAAVIVIESFAYGYFTIYRNTMSPRLAENKTLYRKIFQTHYKRPLDSPLFKDVEELKNFFKDKNERFAGIISTIDNMAWLINKKSTFGYDSKPVLPEMYYLINSMSENYPYELFILKYPLLVFRNLNIGYLLTYRYHSRNFYINYYDTEYSMNYEPNFKPGENWIEIFPVEISKNKNPDGVDLIAYKLLETIPYFYFQDRFELINGNPQVSILRDNDLRERITMSSGDFNNYIKNVIKPDYSDDEKDKNLKSKIKSDIPEFVTRFNRHQNDNKVIKIIEQKANSVKLEVSITKPTVMIRNEAFHKGWSVNVRDLKDNKKTKVKLLKVNYMQQGFPVNPGNYIIEYRFFPETVRKGLVISVSVILLLVLYSYFLINVKKEKF